MPRVSQRRQVTLPLAGCKALSIQPGDEVEIFQYGNQLNIVKKVPGAATGILKGTEADSQISGRESMMGQTP